MLKKWICAVVAFVALTSLAIAANAAESQTVAGVEFTDWTGVSANVASGSLLGHSVTLSPNPTGEVDPPPASTTNGTAPTWNHSYFTPPIPQSDAIHFVANTSGNSYQLQFGAPISNPILHIDSLGSTLSFAGSPSITRVSGESTFTVAGSDVFGQADTPGNDSSGTVQFNGTFSELDFSATYPPGNDGIYLQVGARPPAPPPSTTPPPPPPPFIKAMHRVKTPSYSEDYAVLEAAPSGNWTHLVWDVNGDRKPDIVSDAGQTALRFRPRVQNPYVTVYPIGPGGRGPTERINTVFNGSPWPTAEGRKVQRAVLKEPIVLTTGPTSDLIGANAPRAFCSAENKDPIKTVAGNLEVKGCLTPIGSINDIPTKELGMVEPLVEGTVDYGVCAKCGTSTVPRALTDPTVSLTDGFISKDRILVNGVELDPARAARVVVYPGVNLIASSDAQLRVGDLKFDNRKNFSIDSTFKGDKVPLGTFHPVDAPRGGYGDFAVDRGADIPVDLLAADGARAAEGLIKPTLKLPDWLTSLFPAKVDMRIVDGKPVLDGVHIALDDADIGVAGVKNFKIDYTSKNDEWRGQGTLCLLKVCRLIMDPEHGGGVVVRHGDLVETGAKLDLSPGITLFPGVDLTSIGFKVQTHPTAVTGNGHIRALGIVGIDGSAFAAFGSASEPWFPDRGAVFGFPDEFYAKGHPDTTIGVGGTAGLETPITTIPLSSAYFSYETGRIGFGGRVDRDLGIVEYHGGFEGNIVPPRYRMHGYVHACLDLWVDTVCGGVDGAISSKGFGACLSSGQGGGYIYGDGVTASLWGCRWSEFDEKSIRSRATQASNVYTLRVRKGESPDRMIRIRGATDAPLVRVVGSGAQVRIKRTKPRWKTTFIGLKGAKPGSYTVQLLPGSSPVGGLATGVIPPKAKVKAKLSGHGTRRVLRYSVRRRPGQQVTFVDMSADGAARRIGTTKGGRGKLRFTAAPGRTRRRVVAEFDLAGLPAEEITVARFRPVSPKLGKVRKLKLRRKGKRVGLRWRKVRGASRYEVVLVTSRGKVKRKRTRKRRITLTHIPRTVSGRVSVRAIAKQRTGKPTTRRFRRLAKPKTRFKRLPRCRRKKTRIVCRR